ncbi:MAG TPA: 3-oxoacyl-ACP reductase FabG [Mycobacteriales bacterium]|jgi:3-oxoacyl-[acyl-carrier protein] reductase
MESFTDRVAVVTGGGRGIGAAIAARFAAGGAAVAVLDLDPDTAETSSKAIASAGGRALALGVDIADEDAVEAAVARVAEEFGRIDILVNNAGVTRDNMLFKMSAADWDTVLGVHLRGNFLMSRAVQKHMVERRYGRIVSLSSRSALGNRGQANYSAAKAGVIGLTATLAIELGPFGITVNAVAPGYIDTDMTRATARRMGADPEEFAAAAAAEIPARRVGKPEDVAAVVTFLASEDAGYVNGQTVHVNGGQR